MVWAFRGLVGTVALAASGAWAVTLTGVCGFPTDEAGNWKIGWYNSHGPDGGKNAYLVANNPNGAFLNSGNGASTGISIDLSTPGDYRLYAFFDGDEIYAGRDFWGLNLFFDGQNDVAGISAYGVPQEASDTAPPAFWANSGMTLNLAANRNVSGAGSLVYQSGSTQVLLTEFATTDDVFGLDRVDNFNLGASGRMDHVAVIGMKVVPEPATLLAVGCGLAGLLRRRRCSGS